MSCAVSGGEAMFTDFLYLLRRNGLKVSLTEWMALVEGLHKNLHNASFTGFYHLCRCLLVKSEAALFWSILRTSPFNRRYPKSYWTG